MYRKCLLVVLAIFLFFPIASAGQGLSVSGVSIPDQLVNVDTAVTISVTFNKSLKTFKAGFDFAGIIELIPVNAKISNLNISGHTISAGVILQSETTYQLVISNKFLTGTDGSTLPELFNFVTTFTTGEAIDSNSISGTITPAVDIADVPAFIGCFSEEVDDRHFIRGSRVNSDGSYIIENLPAGDYIVFCAQDVDRNGDLYDVNYGMIRSVVLSEGEQKTGADITISSFNVTSISPQEGTINVDTSTTITIVFDSPVGSENVILGIFPEPLSKSKPDWSNNYTTASFKVTLNKNKIYWK